MASQINPNNIDSTYPVAGQDNDSQGFRDNFTNIKQNFSYASAEITDLQSKAILKAPLTGTTLNNNFNNNLISNFQYITASIPRAALGTVTTATLNFSASSYYTLTTGGAVSVAFTNWAAAGQTCSMRLQVTVASTAHTLVLPNTVSVGTTNLLGFQNNTITFNQTGVYEYEFESSDGGTTISIFDLNRNRDPIYLTSTEDLANAGAVSLGVTTSLIATGAAETATLADGSNGQIKILAMTADSGDMVITVANAGWKTSGSGTVTLNDIGDGCTLLFVNSKWYCVGNNGCVFA